MDSISRLLPGVAHLHNLHPLTVHFPLGFLLGAVLLYLFSAWRPTDKSPWAAFWFLMLGFVACNLAVATGFYAYWEVSLSDSVRRQLAAPHMNWMVVTWILTNILAVWAFMDKPFPHSGRRTFLVLLVMMLIAMIRGADFGSRLVYDYNASGNAVSKPMRYTK